MSEAMGEELVIRAVARVGNDLACCGVRGPGFRTRPRGRQRGALGSMHRIEDLLHLVIGLGFAEDERARDVGLITFHRTATIDHHDRAFFYPLRCNAAVGEGGKLANLYIRAALES